MDFSSFYETVHGYAPHPWQRDLAAKVAETNSWDEAISAPTGAGKTSVLDIAVWHLAHQILTGQPRTAPLRIVHAVERKLIVDGAAQHAHKIASAVDTNPALANIRGALRSLLPSYITDEEPTIMVTSMHGDTVWEKLWWRPVGCSIITGTMTQIVSRVLYRGVGESAGVRPLSAAVLGTDAIRFVDEPHLMIAAVHALREQGAMVHNRRPHTVTLGATLPASMRNTSMFVADMQGKTWNRQTRIHLPEVTPRKVGDTIAEEAITLHKECGGGVVVIVSTLNTATQVAEKIRKKKINTQLVTSHVRPADRHGLTIPMEDGIIVATQTLEVGVDYDARAIVSDLAPLPVLLQRAGRAGRAGGHAYFSVVAHPPVEDDPRSYIYSYEALTETYTKLPEVDFNNCDIHNPEYENTWVEESRRVPLETEFADLLFDTTAPAPWEAFLHGPDHEEAQQVTLLWRKEPQLIDTVPPTASESLTVSISAAKSILTRSKFSEVPDFESVTPFKKPKLGTAYDLTGAYALYNGEKTELPNDIRAIRPGMTIALPTHSGYYTPQEGLNATTTTPVSDVVLDTRQGTEDHTGRVTVPLSAYMTEEDIIAYNSGEMPLSEILNKLPHGATVDTRVARIPLYTNPNYTTDKEPLSLSDHLTQVGDWAFHTAQSAQVHIPAEDYRIAGVCHDLGKIVTGFQKGILGNLGDEPVAKGIANNVAPVTLPTPWRHETGIAHLLDENGYHNAAWLVADHHGKGFIHHRGDELVQAVAQPNFGSPWDASALSAVFRYADWRASAQPHRTGSTMRDIANMIPVEYTEENLFTAAPPTPRAEHNIFHLSGLSIPQDSGMLAAHGAYAKVLEKDPHALIRFTGGIAEIATTLDTIEWVDSTNTFQAGHYNALSEYDASWYTTAYWKSESGKLRMATAIIHNNGSPLVDVCTPPETTEILFDVSAGWSAAGSKIPIFDATDEMARTGGWVSVVRGDLTKWMFAGQMSWGATQTEHGAGTCKQGSTTLLCIPDPSSWSRLPLTVAMARRGVGKHLVRSAYKTSDKASRWVPRS